MSVNSLQGFWGGVGVQLRSPGTLDSQRSLKGKAVEKAWAGCGICKSQTPELGVGALILYGTGSHRNCRAIEVMRIHEN